MAVAGRNDPCPCGSGRKYKHCCLSPGAGLAPAADRAIDGVLAAARQHHRNGRLEQAETLYREVLSRDSGRHEALNLLGALAQQSGRHAVAVELFRQAIQGDGSVGGYHYNLGNSLRALNRHQEAFAALRDAVRLAPRLAEAHYDLGRCLVEMGLHEDAIESFRQALAVRPDFPEVHNNLGMLLARQGRQAEAEASFRKAVRARPDYAIAWCNLGYALQSQSRPDDAVAAYRKALAVRPDMAGALANLQYGLLSQGRGEEALKYSRRPMSAGGDEAWAHSTRLFSSLYLPDFGPGDTWSLHQQFAEKYEKPFRAGWPTHSNVADPARRLRVGYVSPNLNAHSVAFFMEPILAHHDRERVEVWCYSDSPVEDDVSRRLAGLVDRWERTAGWPDQMLADRIRQDGIDILVDLAGHTLDNRLLVFARRPAPVQVSYLGYPATTGLTGMDYRLVTADTDPSGAEAWHSEKLLRLPRTLWCYRPSAPDLTVDPVTPAARAGHITFISSNNIAKLSPAAISLWARILGAIADSRMVLTGIPAGSARERLLERFASQGVDPERITIHGRLPASEFQSLAQAVDLALDPFPYSGTTTTCEALWMGIPVITQVGETSVSRSSYAILRSLGLEELSAPDAEGYLRIAVELAGNPARLSALRAGLRERMEGSPLRDEVRMAGDIEDAYRTAWRAWCAGRAAGT